MKTIKPQRLGVLHRTFEHAGKKLFVPTVLVAFPLDNPGVLLHEVIAWKTMVAELGEGDHVAIDEGMYKPHGELVVTGSAYPPNGPQPGCKARIVLGPDEHPVVDKSVYVVGDRQWTATGPTAPVPFTAIPIDWTRAFGGKGFNLNPVGRGFEKDVLPNIEDPNQLVRGPGDKPKPVGFRGLPVHWPQRFQKTGTYDAAWRKTRYPGLADDVDLTFFNQAPTDQWIKGYFKGGEAFRIENMHPSEAVITGVLPRVIGRCFVTRNEAGKDLEEIKLSIDTVHLFPGPKVGVLFYRGVALVQEDDAADIKHLLVAAEGADEPRPRSHYERVLAERLDKELGAFRGLRDSELMPPRPLGTPRLAVEAFSDMSDLCKTEGRMTANQRRKAQAELDKLRSECMAEGVDPDKHLPKELPPPAAPTDLEKLAELYEEQMAQADEQRIVAEKESANAMAEARKAAEDAGYDFDAMMEKARADQGGPPKFKAADELARLRADYEAAREAGADLPHVRDMLASPDLEVKLRTAETQLVVAYRQFAHHFPAARRMDQSRAAALREEVQHALATGAPLAERDFTGADLSNMRLSGVDLRGVFLESANLSLVDFSGANLAGAVLARADLRGANLTGANLAEANLGEANLEDALLENADLTKAILSKAWLTRTKLGGAKLDEAEFLETHLANVDLSAVNGKGLLFFRLDMRGVKLDRATIVDAILFEVNLDGAQFENATLSRTTFLTCRAEGARFSGAKLDDVRTVKDSIFAKCDFRGCDLRRAQLRSTNLSDSDFSGADLSDGDLSESDLRRAAFYRATAKRTLMMKSDLRGANLRGINLMEGFLTKANIRAADFTGANLFRVDFARTDGDQATKLDGAFMSYIRFVAKEGGMQT